ncbi:hypothetical protein NEOC65_002400 [Neochlamydia sp. AcF65]|nr:hypothetical protein [Neochlamydia sp. AcF65]
MIKRPVIEKLFRLTKSEKKDICKQNNRGLERLSFLNPFNMCYLSNKSKLNSKV